MANTQTEDTQEEYSTEQLDLMVTHGQEVQKRLTEMVGTHVAQNISLEVQLNRINETNKNLAQHLEQAKQNINQLQTQIESYAQEIGEYQYRINQLESQENTKPDTTTPEVSEADFKEVN